MNVFSIAFLIGVIGAAALAGGRFQTVPVQPGSLYVVDRFTGATIVCVTAGCRELRTLPPVSAP